MNDHVIDPAENLSKIQPISNINNKTIGNNNSHSHEQTNEFFVRRSSRQVKTPSQSTHDFDIMIQARRASANVIRDLIAMEAISKERRRVCLDYPTSICGVSKCGLRV